MGRFCLNCGHPIGAPVSPDEPGPAAVAPVEKHHGWDPADDLLPYSDSFDPELDTPLPGSTWIAWVMGAALLMGLALVVLALVGTGNQPTPPAADQPGGQTPENAVATPEDLDPQELEVSPDSLGVGRPFNATPDATIAVPSTTPATTDLDGELVAYTADKMQDGLPTTAWRMPGDGTDSTITITLAEPMVVNRVGLINGYAKEVNGVDWYPNNRRILTARWGFEDGSTLVQTFETGRRLQRAKVPAVLTATVTLTITSVTAPGSGAMGRDYTAISEVAVLGRRAG